MSGTTTGGSSARTIDFAALRPALAAARGRARGRNAAQDLATELSKLRRDPAGAGLLRAFETGATVALTPAMETVLAGAGVDAAAVAAAVVAPASPSGSAATAGGAGALTISAGGTGTIAVPGTALAAGDLGYEAAVSVMTRDPAAGTRGGADVRVVVKRETGAAQAAVASVVNRYGTMFGAVGAAGAAITVAATCSADGSAATLTLTNADAVAPRAVAYAVRRVAG